MSSNQMARRRSAVRVPLERRNEPASLCSFAGTAATPVPRVAGMNTPANAACRRHDIVCLRIGVTEAMP